MEQFFLPDQKIVHLVGGTRLPDLAVPTLHHLLLQIDAWDALPADRKTINRWIGRQMRSITAKGIAPDDVWNLQRAIARYYWYEGAADKAARSACDGHSLDDPQGQAPLDVYAGAPYSYFSAAYEVHESLSQAFENSSNPGLIIGRHLSNLLLRPQPRVHGRRLDSKALLLLEIERVLQATPAASVNASTEMLGLRRALEFMMCSDAEVGEKIWPFLATAPWVESKLFEQAIDSLATRTRLHALPALSVLLISLVTRPDRSALLQARHNLGPEIRVALDEHCSSWLQYPDKVPGLPMRLLLELLSQSELFEVVFSYSEWDQRQTLVSTLADDFKASRTARDYYAPADGLRCGLLSGGYRDLFEGEPDDLVLRLVDTGVWHLGGRPAGLQWIESATCADERAAWLAERAEYYLSTSDIARDEGLDELAAGLLSFFLFTQVSAESGLGCPVGEVLRRVKAFQGMPEEHVVMEGIRHGVRRLRECRRPLEADALQKLVPMMGGRDSGLAFGVTPTSDRRVIDCSLQQQLPLTRKHFTRDAWECLVDAEYKFAVLSAKAPASRNWGTECLGYIKALELELAHRLTPLLHRDDYKEWLQTDQPGQQIRGKPTLGSMHHLLKSLNRMPESLQAAAKGAGIVVHEDPPLMQRLQRLVQIRNASAHPGTIPGTTVVKLRESLVKKKEFDRFASLLWSRPH